MLTITAQNLGTIISIIGALGIACVVSLFGWLIAAMLRYRAPSEDAMQEPHGDVPIIIPAKRPAA